jgi:DNA polymerase-4
MALVPDRALAATLGRAHAAHLHAISWNRDPRRVRAPARRRSIGSQSALGRPRHHVADLDVALLAIVDRVARRLRADERLAHTITLRLRFGDSERITRSLSVDMPTDLTEPIAVAGRELLTRTEELVRERGCTLIGLALSNLVPRDPLQLTLPFPRPGRANRALDAAVDGLQARFGNAAITRASLVKAPRLRHSFGEPLYES